MDPGKDAIQGPVSTTGSGYDGKPTKPNYATKTTDAVDAKVCSRRTAVAHGLGLNSFCG